MRQPKDIMIGNKTLETVLIEHKNWLNNVKENACRADMSGADMSGANLDFSCMPLWCGDLKANYDEKQIVQQLYHVVSHIKNSKNSTDLLKSLITDDVIKIANKFHRVDEGGQL